MKIEEIMTKQVISLNPDDNAAWALEFLLERNISGLPVCDAHAKLLGMFTEKEVIAKILPSYTEKVGKFIYADNPKIVKQKILEFTKLKVKDVMRTEVVSVDQDTALFEVAHLMFTQKVRRTPVLNKAKEVIGIIARQDVIKALFREHKSL